MFPHVIGFEIIPQTITNFTQQNKLLYDNIED